MSQEALVLAFRRALERQAWLEAANLVHPDDARRLQQADIRRLAGWMAAARFRQKPGVGDEAIIFVNRDIAHSHRQVEEFRESPVHLVPQRPPARRTGQLASAGLSGGPSGRRCASRRSRATGAASGSGRHGRGVADVVRVELRAPELAGDEEEGLAEVRLHRHQGSWRVALEPDDFRALLP